MTKSPNDESVTPHDKFAKCALKNRAIAVDFFAVHWLEIGLEKHELSTIALSNNEHQQQGKPKLQSDVIYRGRIAGQEYVFSLEHQSSSKNDMLIRVMEYTIALMKEHIEQGRKGMPVVLPLCLIISVQGIATRRRWMTVLPTLSIAVVHY